MRPSLHFVVVAVGLVVVGVLGTALLAGEDARRSALGAGALSLATQVPAFLALRGWRSRTNRFLAALATGFALRVLVLLCGVVAVAATGWAEPVSFIVALGGFTIALAFAESLLEYRRAVASPPPPAT